MKKFKPDPYYRKCLRCKEWEIVDETSPFYTGNFCWDCSHYPDIELVKYIPKHTE